MRDGDGEVNSICKQPSYMLMVVEWRVPEARELGLEESFLPHACASSQETCSMLGLRDAKGTVPDLGSSVSSVHKGSAI